MSFISTGQLLMMLYNCPFHTFRYKAIALLLECRRRRRGCYTSCARFPIEHDSQNKYFPALVGLSSFNDYCTVQLSVHRLHYYYFLFLYKLWIHIFQFNSKCLELQFIRIFIPDDTQKRAQRLCPGSWWCFPIHPVITINPNNRQRPLTKKKMKRKQRRYR